MSVQDNSTTSQATDVKKSLFVGTPTSKEELKALSQGLRIIGYVNGEPVYGKQTPRSKLGGRR